MNWFNLSFVLILVFKVYSTNSWTFTKEFRKCASIRVQSIPRKDAQPSNCDSLRNGNTYYSLQINSTNVGHWTNISHDLENTFGNCSVHNDVFSLSINLGCFVELCDFKGHCLNANATGEKIFHEAETDLLNYTLTDIWQYDSISCQCTDDTSVPIQNISWNGVIFSAYDKYPEPCTNNGGSFCPISWWNYTKDDILPQLNLISTRFNQISTYGMGTVENYLGDGTNVKKDWKDNAVWSAWVPLWAAELNKAAGYFRFQVVVGIFQLPDYTKEWVGNETENAILATKEANGVFPGSIWGISVQVNLYPEALGNGFKKDVDILQRVKKRFPHKDVQVGSRIIECEKVLYENLRSEDISRLYCRPNDKNCKSEMPSTLQPNFTEIAKNSDFIICFIRPPGDLLIENTTMEAIVQQMGKKLLEIKSAFKKVNNDIEIIGETGWPSEGITSNGSPNTLKNLVEYWLEIEKWGKENEFKFYMFEAFDEPWKNNNDVKDKKHSGGICGSEAHYGWWKRVNNSFPATYIQKIDEILHTNQTLSDNSPIESALIPHDCVIDTLISKEIYEAGGLAPGSLMLVIGISVFLIATFIAILTYMGHRLRRANSTQIVLSQKYLEMFNKGLSPEQLEGQGDYNVIALQFPYDRRKYELDKDTFQIDYSKLLGKGQSGTVYIGEIKGYPRQVAFKTTNATSTIIDIKNILSEIKILSYIGQHENVVSILAAYTEQLNRGVVSIALEYCQLGSLEKILREFHQSSYNNTQTTLINSSYVTTAVMNEPITFKPLQENGLQVDFTLLPVWAYQIANGMEYLASKRVVHADLAARNVLVDSNKIVKITDFGLSRKLYHEIGETLDPEIPLPWRWMCPESLRHLTFSTETDIWSYGVVLWEIFSLGDVPYPAVSFNNQFILDLQNGCRMDSPRLASPEIYDVCCKCWSLNPKERPSFTQIKIDLQSCI